MRFGVDESGCVYQAETETRIGHHDPVCLLIERYLNEEPNPQRCTSRTRKTTTTSVVGSRGLPKMENFAKALRPMITTLYAILDELYRLSLYGT